MLSDLRFAFRQLAKAPGFTAIIVVTLALSIGACTAIYTAFDRIALNPYDDPATKRNVALRSVKLPERTEGGISYPDFLDLETRATSFEFMVHYTTYDVNLTGTAEPMRLRRNVTTPRYFDVFGVKMALGRWFLPEEFVAGKDNVVVLTYGCWQRAFGGAQDIIGRSLLINENPCTVVGVTTESFQRSAAITELWSPLAANRPANPNVSDPRTVRGYANFAIARLRPGVTLAQAQAELDVIAAALADSYPDSNRNFGFMATRTMTHLRNVVPAVRILAAAVGCLMLIACANVAGLLLVRANARLREMSVRAALGATRGRLVRQLLTENIIVAAIGGAAGILLAQWALDFIAASIPTGTLSLIAGGGTGLTQLSHVKLDVKVLGFALSLTLATALIFGLAPAWLSASADLNEALKQGTRGSTEGRGRRRFRATLIIAEIAMAVTLLSCSALIVRSFLKLSGADLGFDPRQTAFVRVAMPPANYANLEQRIAFTTSLLSRIQNTGGVDAVGTTNYFPFSGVNFQPAGFEVEGGRVVLAAERPLAYSFSVSPDYFRTMGIPLQQGRFFSDRDDLKSQRVAIINQTLARQYFPNQDPIGKRITIGNPSDGWRIIVGVVGDVGLVNLGDPPSAQLYEPCAQKGTFGFVVIRGPGNPALLPAIIKREMRALDPDLPVGDVSTAGEFVRHKLTMQRLTLQLLTAFTAIGLFVAAIGIYGVIAFSVNQRTVEIGIRMALGAQKEDVLRLVMSQGAWIVGIGFALGIVATFIAGRAIESQLYNTSGHDPIALVSITVFFAAVAALACWLPARRATKVDPVVALRAE